MKKFLKNIYKSEEGYGTVELLLIVAGIGLLATTLFNKLNKNLVTKDNSTTDQVTNGINDLIGNWIEEGGE